MIWRIERWIWALRGLIPFMVGAWLGGISPRSPGSLLLAPERQNDLPGGERRMSLPRRANANPRARAPIGRPADLPVQGLCERKSPAFEGEAFDRDESVTLRKVNQLWRRKLTSEKRTDLIPSDSGSID
jgi:hypothetical protein